MHNTINNFYGFLYIVINNSYMQTGIMFINCAFLYLLRYNVHFLHKFT